MDVHVNNQKNSSPPATILDAIPTTRRDTTARALLIPGTTVTPFVLGQYNLTSHGSASSDFTMAIDGLRVNNLCGSGQYSGFYMNDAAVQELTYSTGSESAEIQSSGIRVNSIPKDGGNKFSGSFFVYGQGSGLQSDNRTDAMRRSGQRPAAHLDCRTAYDWQINPSFGGPLVKDKLWFYVTYKYQKDKHYVPSSQFADGSPAFREGMGSYSGIGRVTWAPRARTRFASTSRSSSPASSTTGSTPADRHPRRRATPRVSDDPAGAVDARAIEQAAVRSRHRRLRPDVLAGLQRTGARRPPAENELLDRPAAGKCGYTIPPYGSTTKDYNMMASASYVTGSHAMKFGMTDLWGENSRTFAPAANIDTLLTIKRRRPGATTSRPRCRLQLTRDVDPERQQRHRRLRSGHLDDEAAHVELRGAVRALQRVAAGGVFAGVHLDRRRGTSRRFRPAELERLGGPLRGGLRSVRYRQDRHQGRMPASTSRPRRPAWRRRSTA